VKSSCAHPRASDSHKHWHHLQGPSQTSRPSLVVMTMRGAVAETNYNRRRRQRALGRLTPAEFETVYTTAEAA